MGKIIVGKTSEIPAGKMQKVSVDGREILQGCFRAALKRDPLIFAIGEDVGKIGDVNQGFAGLQNIFGEHRVTDTGIRETTIVGQGIGAALRGLRPIVEIQYLDYIFYAVQTLADDLASLHYRTMGGQKAPLIVRTRGHRLEGVWHSGSPMGMMLSALRGIYLLVPRNMTQAAGFYNTLLRSDDTAIMVECLNGYRLKEKVPDNLGSFTVPLGVPEVLRQGDDVTIITYGAMCRIVLDAAEELQGFGISAEVIDVQTLLQPTEPWWLKRQSALATKRRHRRTRLHAVKGRSAPATKHRHLRRSIRSIRLLERSCSAFFFTNLATC